MKKNIKSNLRESILQSILSKISVEALAQSIGMQIDLARISFTMDFIIVSCFEELNDCLLAYYAHLLRQLNRLKVPSDFAIISAEVFSLLDRSFINKGGVNAAVDEAQTGFSGGMRYILDEITNQFKKEEQGKIVTQVLKYSFDPLAWDIKVSLIKELIEILKPNLPAEIYSQPPERFANHYETLVRSYINSIDQLKHIFQSI